MPIFKDKEQDKMLHDIQLKEAEDLAQLLANKYGIPYTDLGIVPVSPRAIQIVDEKRSREANLAVFEYEGKLVKIAILTPNNKHLKPILEDLDRKNLKVELFLASELSLEKAWARYAEVKFTKSAALGMIEISTENLKRLMKEINNVGDLAAILKKELEVKSRRRDASTIIETIMAGGLATRASDIHIEPQEDEARLRLRLDGVLQDVMDLDNKMYHTLVSRIKILSGVKLNVKKKAQDGRMSIRIGESDIEIRTSVLPDIYGEAIVMRILNPDTVQLDMEKLGINEKLFKVIKREIQKPHGLLLNTGPTGSGKTTSLYSFLKFVNKPGIKIITIEDPVEYHLAGVTQTQTRKGYGFLEGLRASLRQDPDVIMVGEIRDIETASIAINAALTGHLVFSTLHTNNAAGAIPRLLDLGVERKIIGSALTLALAQRLVRILCVHCKREDNLTPDEQKMVARVIEGMPLEYKKEMPDLSTAKIFRPQSCEECNGTGYKGRQGIFEGVHMTKAVEDAILTQPSEDDIWNAAKSQGLLKMPESGILKLLAGQTSIEDIQRVVELGVGEDSPEQVKAQISKPSN